MNIIKYIKQLNVELEEDFKNKINLNILHDKYGTSLNHINCITIENLINAIRKFIYFDIIRENLFDAMDENKNSKYSEYVIFEKTV